MGNDKILTSKLSSPEPMAITTRSMNQPEDNPPREEEVAPPPTNPVPNAPAPNPQQMLETMQQLVAQNQQILQLMLAGQGGAQLGGAQHGGPQGAPRPGHQGAPHLGARAGLGTPFGVPLGVPHRGAHHEGP